MSSFQYKVTRHVKTRKVCHIPREKCSPQKVTLRLKRQTLYTTYYKYIQGTEKTKSKELKKNIIMISLQEESINKYVETVRENQ